MASTTNLMQMGCAPGLAAEICGRVASGLTATGTLQSDALLAPAIINVVTTTATGTGIRLPPGDVGTSMIVSNLGANTLLIYPSVGQSFNTSAVNAGFNLASTRSVQFFYTGATWISISSA